MTTVASDAVVAKIQKLLALSRDKANEHEAARAAEKVQELLATYNLSISEVDLKTTSKVEDVIVADRELRTDSRPWRRSIAMAVGEMYFCRYFFQHDYQARKTGKGYVRHDIHFFVGAKHNVAVAKMMFHYLSNTVDRLASQGAKSVSPRERSAYTTSFRAACTMRLVQRIRIRIQEAKAGQVKTESGQNLPALLDLYEQTARKLQIFIDQNVGRLKSKHARMTTSHGKGVADGREAGDRIGLDTQVGGRSATTMIR